MTEQVSDTSMRLCWLISAGKKPLQAEELPLSSAPSSAPTTDGTQLSSVSLSVTHPDKPLVPISEEGGAAANLHEDPTPPTSAGETD